MCVIPMSNGGAERVKKGSQESMSQFLVGINGPGNAQAPKEGIGWRCILRSRSVGLDGPKASPLGLM